MNIVEEYTLQNKQLIILISGLSGTNKSALAKEIQRDLKIKLENLDDYCDKKRVKIMHQILKNLTPTYCANILKTLHKKTQLNFFATIYKPVNYPRLPSVASEM